MTYLSAPTLPLHLPTLYLTLDTHCPGRMVMALRPPAGSAIAASQALILGAVKDLLTYGYFSDLTITCRGENHEVHKNIVYSRAGYFEEAVEGTIELDHKDPDTLRRLIQYMYTGEYEPKSCLVTPSDLLDDIPHTCRRVCPGSSGSGAVVGQQCSQYLCAHHECGNHCDMDCDKFICFECFPPAYGHLLIHSKMYECAKNYDVTGLKDVAKKNFDTVCSLAWDQAVFAEAAAHAFSSTPDSDKGLRDIIVQTIYEHPELLRKPEIHRLMEEFNSLAVGIIERKLHNGWNN